jgi:serine acetyltransferase
MNVKEYGIASIVRTGGVVTKSILGGSVIVGVTAKVIANLGQEILSVSENSKEQIL